MIVRFFEGTSFSYCCPSRKNVFGIDKTCVRDDYFSSESLLSFFFFFTNIRKAEVSKIRAMPKRKRMEYPHANSPN